MYCFGKKLVLCNSTSLNSTTDKNKQEKPLNLGLCD